MHLAGISQPESVIIPVTNIYAPDYNLGASIKEIGWREYALWSGPGGKCSVDVIL